MWDDTSVIRLAITLCAIALPIFAQPPFPVVRDWNSVRIALERTGCFGSCPTYSIEIRGDGKVTYVGTGFVVVLGSQVTTISPDHVRSLIEEFRRQDFFAMLSMPDSIMISDGPGLVITLTIDGRSRTIDIRYGDAEELRLASPALRFGWPG